MALKSTNASKTVRERGSGTAARKGAKRGAKDSGTDGISPRENILRVAASLFSHNGYAGTTMADIADAVGIRSPSLYYHFTDKADILVAIADITLQSAVSDSRTLLDDSEKPVPDRLYSLVHDLVLRLRQSPYELYCMFDVAFFQDEFRTVNKKLTSWLKDMELLIRKGIEDGSFEDQDPKFAAYAVRGLIESAIRMVGGYASRSSEDVASFVARYAVKGLLKGATDLGS